MSLLSNTFRTRKSYTGTVYIIYLGIEPCFGGAKLSLSVHMRTLHIQKKLWKHFVLPWWTFQQTEEIYLSLLSCCTHVGGRRVFFTSSFICSVFGDHFVPPQYFSRRHLELKFRENALEDICKMMESYTYIQGSNDCRTHTHWYFTIKRPASTEKSAILCFACAKCNCIVHFFNKTWISKWFKLDNHSL